MSTRLEVFTADALPDSILGAIFTAAGGLRGGRGAAGVNRRWRRVFFSEPGIWADLTASCSHIEHLDDTQREQQLDSLLLLARRAAPVLTSVKLCERSRSLCLAGLLASQRLPELLLALQPAALTSLIVEGIWARDEAAGPLQRLSRLETLHLNEQRLGLEGDVAAAVLQLGALRCLSLQGRSLPAALPAELAEQLPLLEELHLASAEGPLPDCQPLSSLWSLTKLSLEEGSSTDDGLAMPDPSVFDELGSFRVAAPRMQLPVSGIALELGGMGGEISIRRSSRTPACVMRLKAVQLAGGGLAAALAELQPAAVWGSHVQCILQLQDCHVSEVAFAGCESQLSAVAALSLIGCTAASEAALANAFSALLGHTPHLCHLHITGWDIRFYMDDDDDHDVAGNLADGLPAAVAQLAHLQHLSVRHAQLQSLPDGPYMAALRELDLEANHLPASIFRVLASATNLHTLNLSGNPDLRLTPEGVDVLAALPALQTLRLGDTAPASQVAALARRAPRLNIL